MARAVELSLPALTGGPRRRPGDVNLFARERTRAMLTRLFMRPVVPGVQKVTIPAAGHHPNPEHPERFNEIVLSFLQGIE